MYVITRRDLSTGMQFAQSVHAALEFSDDFEVDDTVIVLTVADEMALTKLALEASQYAYDCVWFEEPDLDDAITAIALPAEAKHLLRKLPLAGK